MRAFSRLNKSSRARPVAPSDVCEWMNENYCVQCQLLRSVSLDFVCTERLLNMHRCRAFPFALARLCLFSPITYYILCISHGKNTGYTIRCRSMLAHCSSNEIRRRSKEHISRRTMMVSVGDVVRSRNCIDLHTPVWYWAIPQSFSAKSTLCPKTLHFLIVHYLGRILTDFKNSIIGTFCGQLAIKLQSCYGVSHHTLPVSLHYFRNVKN